MPKMCKTLHENSKMTKIPLKILKWSKYLHKTFKITKYPLNQKYPWNAQNTIGNFNITKTPMVPLN